MTRPAELVDLTLLDGWRCGVCGGQWITQKGAAALFHRCAAWRSRSSTRIAAVPRRDRHIEEPDTRVRDGLAAAFGVDLLRPVEEDS